MKKMQLGTVELLATAVREWRAALGLSTEALALMGRTTSGFVSDLEAGQGAHDLRSVLRILKALGIHAVSLPSVAHPNPPRLADVNLDDHLANYDRHGVAPPPATVWPPFPAKRPVMRTPTRIACWCTTPACTRLHHRR
jgi:transcriptional regulator with XRE-family HTH domain